MSLLIFLLALPFGATDACQMPRSANKVGFLLELSNHHVNSTLTSFQHMLTCSAMLAIEHSNQGYGYVAPRLADPPYLQLEGLLFDTQGLQTGGLEAYAASREAGVAVIVGASRSAVTEPVAVLSASDSLPIIGYWSSSPNLARPLYDNFQRTFPSDEIAASALASTMPYFGWSHFSVLQVSDPWGYGYAEALITQSVRVNMSLEKRLTYTHGEPASAQKAVQGLTRPSSGLSAFANVIVLLAFKEDLPAILEEAENQQLLEWPYVWFLGDALLPEYVDELVDSGELSQTLYQKLSGFNQLLVSPEALPGFARFKEVWQSLTPADCSRLVPGDHAPLAPSAFAHADMMGAYLYDAAVTAALGLRATSATSTAQASTANGESSSGETGTQSDGVQLAAAIRALNFSGGTDQVSFDATTGDRSNDNLELVAYNWRVSDGRLASVPVGSIALSSTQLANGGVVEKWWLAAPPTILGNITWVGTDQSVWPISDFAPPDAIDKAMREAALEEEEALRRARERERHLTIGLCVALAAVLLVAMGLAVRRFKPEVFRPTVKILSHDDGSLAPNVAFVTDIEGNWDYFERFVKLSEGLSFPMGEPEFNSEGAADLVLAEGWRFIHGGDTCDKGGVVGGSIRVTRTLCRLKRKYPNRVVLLLGNRDLNKIRLSSELDTTSPHYARAAVDGTYQGAKWLPAAKRVSPDLYLRRVLAKTLNCNPDEVPEESVNAADTLPNRLRWMYKETMGAEGEFERQCAEQALLRKVKRETLSEYDVARAIILSVMPGGAMRELLELGQLAFVHADILFLHGGLVGGPWEGSADGVDCFGYVPGRAARVTDAHEWVRLLNEWKQQMLAAWMRQPFWSETDGGGAPTRAADAIIDYVCPGCVPSVVMGRHQDAKGMPKPVPRDLVSALTRSGITVLALGHTPQGNAPTAVQCGGLLVVAADTSFSDMSASDKRGVAVSEVQFLQNGTLRVVGMLQDERIISFALPDRETSLLGFQLPAVDEPPASSRPAEPGLPPGPTESVAGAEGSAGNAMLESTLATLVGGKPYHIKAWLPEEEQYILCNVDGFVVSYLALTKAETQLLFERARRLGAKVPTEEEIAKATEPRAPVAVSAARLTRTTSWTERMTKARDKLDRASRARPVKVSSTKQLRVDKTTSSPAPRALFHSESENSMSRKDVQVLDLGDVDVIGLAEDAVEEMRMKLVKTLDAKKSENAHQTKLLNKQARRLGRSLREVSKFSDGDRGSVKNLKDPAKEAV